MDANVRINIVEYYLKNGVSLKETGRRFGVHYQTVFKWVKLYKKIQNGEVKKGEDIQFFSGYKKPWNRFPKDIEVKIVSLKENNPSITIRKAKEILEKEGIKVSVKGIWSVWKRYGYSGFKKENMTNDFIEYCEWSKEAKAKFEFAKFLFERGQIKKCAEILNTIPFLPKNNIISSIPDEYLNLRRRIEKIAILFGKVQLEEYLEKIQKINYELKSKKFYYSLLRIGLIEAVCFLWKGEPNLSLRKIKKLERLLSNLRSSSLFPIYFNLLISKGIAYTLLMEINIANKIAYVCSKILKNKKYVSPYYFENLGTLYMNLEKFKKAEYYFLKCLDKVEENINKNIKGGLAMISLLKGDYEKARIMATDAEFGEWSPEGWNLLFYSLLFLIKGMPQKTISYCLNALSLLKQQELGWGIVASFLTMAFCYSGLGEKKKAINILKDVIPFLHEKKLKRILPIVKILITKNYSINKNVFPTIKLLLLLKNYGYRKAFIYAKKNYLLTYLYRYLLFFPEKVNKALQRGEKIEIPKTLLKFPVFNKDYLTFNIRFLSPFKIYRNHKLMKIKLSLREKAFLIYLSQKLKEPEDSIIVEEIYKNFWSHSLSPRRNFSRIFLKIRQKLKIPFNFFNIKKQKENPILLNKRIYFRTDLDEFNEKISKGKIFLRIGKNKNAKKEFLRAFSLIKCKPFEKMYDRFSEDKRTEIIFKINDAFKEFLKTNPSKEEIEKIKKRFEKLKIFITF